jgi:hypothetical protein
VKGTLAIMAACPADALAVVEPVVAYLGRVFHVGTEPGTRPSRTVPPGPDVLARKLNTDPRVSIVMAGGGRRLRTVGAVCQESGG